MPALCHCNQEAAQDEGEGLGHWDCLFKGKLVLGMCLHFLICAVELGQCVLCWLHSCVEDMS